MKMFFNRKTSTLMDPADVFAWEIDPLVHRTNLEKAEAILSQNRGLLQEDVEDEKGCPEPEVSQEPLGVWICYITDNYGDPIMVKLVSTDVQAHEWVQGRPRTIGLIDDGTRGKRFVEYHNVEVERS